MSAIFFLPFYDGWSGGAKVLGKLPVPGRPTILITVGQGPTALAVGAGGGCLDIFTLIYPFSPLSPSLWETARYRLKYCLKGPLNPNQPTNQSLSMQNHSQHYYISSCAYTGVDNSRKFLLSRSFRIGIWKISIMNADFTHFHDFVHACN